MRLKRYGVYLMCGAPRIGAIYTGMSGDIAERALENGGKKAGGAAWPLRYHAKHLVYYEIYDDYALARQREIHIKGWKRDWKMALIEKMNPAWTDLQWELEKKLQA